MKFLKIIFVIGVLMLIIHFSKVFEMESGKCTSGTIWADRWENRFDVLLGLDVELPIGTQHFERLLKKNDLDFEKVGGDHQLPIPQPWNEELCSQSIYGTAYFVYGGYNSIMKRSEFYTAYIDSSEMVIHIESQFAYNE